MTTAEPRLWTSLPEVLREELKLIRPGWGDVPLPDEASEAKALRDLYACIAAHARERRDRLSALCLSGGGIRSATFNLGVLQALARADVLHRFDYLSTVSGGGYIGSWLEAWIARARTAQKARPDGDRRRQAVGCVQDDAPAPANSPLVATDADRLPEDDGSLREVARLLCRPGRTTEEAKEQEGVVDNPLAPEPEPINRLRELGNYLTPRTGLLSGDTWTVAAIVLRNLFLNWLVILPVIAAAVMVPQGAFVMVTNWQFSQSRIGWAMVASGVALALGLAASVINQWLRTEPRSTRRREDGVEGQRALRRRRRVRGWLSFASVSLLVAAAALFALATIWVEHAWWILPGLAGKTDPGIWVRAARAAIWTIGVPLVGTLLATLARALHGTPLRGRAIAADLLAIPLSGAMAAVVLGWVLGEPAETLRPESPLFTVLALPILLLFYVLARALFNALQSPFLAAGPDRPDLGVADREWWGRVTGHVLLVAAVWAGASTLVLIGTWLVGAGLDGAYNQVHGPLAGVVSALAALSGLATGLLGKSAGTPSGRPGPRTSRLKHLALKLVAPATVALVIVLLAFGTAWLARAIAGYPECFLVVKRYPLCEVKQGGAMALSFLAIAVSLLLVAGLAGFFVNVNRFSLHAMYRSRLVRAYLGASNLDRRPDLSTGFDEKDEELPLASLAPASGEAPPKCGVRLFPVVNATLNLLAGERLAWLERRAESFSMTPLFCGNFHEGYRRTRDYGGPRGEGVSLATAMAISGAAANPNMGYVSTPALTFLMALLDARLGVWLPNTNENGGEDVARLGPPHATNHLVKEMLGLTTRYAPFVNLSDGGHFDNLGLYEMVLRRCKFVFVSDASCDPRHKYGDLGNALRKIRIDFGIPIEFEREFELRPRADRPRAGALYCSIARIRYDVPDGGTDADVGTLVYLKPTVEDAPKASVPYDVRAYANAFRAFPHQSTVDQWFSESQFESYRALGAYLVETMLGTTPLKSLAELEDSLRWYLRHGETIDETVRAQFETRPAA